MSISVLVTAGSTRNPIDAMRHIAAFSSGRTGVRIAEILRERGADVHLLGSSEAVLRAERIPSTETFTSTRDLMARMRNWLREHPKGWVIHSAAVGDYEAVAEKGKIASGQESLTIHLQAAPKIIDHLKAWAPESKLVGFKAAGPETSTEGLVAACRTLGFRCRANWVFGNVLGELEHTATLVDRFGAESFSDREAAFQVLAAHVLA
ncbi:MAG: phosphopantothenoylcysteine decarboxylase [Myxococcota bacterium]|nr:phosphopantothenoylcysteine decarboxylase [Myxococcota bacterium]